MTPPVNQIMEPLRTRSFLKGVSVILPAVFISVLFIPMDISVGPASVRTFGTERFFTLPLTGLFGSGVKTKWIQFRIGPHASSREHDVPPDAFVEEYKFKYFVMKLGRE